MSDTIAIPAFEAENTGQLIRDRRYNYLTVNAIAKRVRQLQLIHNDRPGAMPTDPTKDFIAIATQEYLDNKLLIVPKGQEMEYEEIEAEEEQSEPAV